MSLVPIRSETPAADNLVPDLGQKGFTFGAGSLVLRSGPSANNAVPTWVSRRAMLAYRHPVTPAYSACAPLRMTQPCPFRSSRRETHAFGKAGPSFPGSLAVGS